MPGRRSTSARRRATSSFLSAADTELACLAAAQARRPPDAPEPAPRQPPAARPPAVGRPVCRAGGRPRAPGRPAPARRPQLLALRPGAGRRGLPRRRHPARRACPATTSPTRSCARWSTLPAEACHRLWQYLVHGGLDNAGAAARLRRRACSAATSPGASRRRCCAPGCTGRGWRARISTWCARAGDRADRSLPWCSIGPWCRRAISTSIDALIDGLGRSGAQSRCRSSPPASRTRSARRWCASCSQQARPAVVLNATGFAVSSARRVAADAAATSRTAASSRWCSPAAARRPGAPARAASSARDLAMNVALPEVDGRVLSRAVAFKAPQALRSRDREQHRRLRPGRRPGRVHRRAGGRLGAPARHAGGRAAGRDRARQLPQPRRPDRQRRRPRHAGEHHRGCSRRCARPAIGSTGCRRTARR